MTRDELLRLIDRAAKQGQKSLRLSWNQLAELPPEIGQLTSLRSLDLSNNQLSRLPPEISQLSSLQSLSLFSNYLRSLPPEIGQLTSLQSLVLSSNYLRSLPPEIGQLTSLQSLDLISNQLSYLPPEIGQLTSLQSLDLSSNRLSRLPPEISQLSSLQSLYLNNNQLSYLPPEIGQLTSLRSLDLSDNELSSLPPEIGQLSLLRSLYLNNNQLSSLPPEIGQLTSLQSLYLNNNQLSSLPPEIGQLASLQSLFLIYNQLSSLPPEIGQLTALRSLNLSSNQLSSLPPEIGQLSSLQSLSLIYNQLSSLPPEIGQLTALRSLSLIYNQLSSLLPEIGQLTALQLLDFDNVVDPPPEVIRKGTREILNYLKQQLEQGRDFIYEAKFLIVGEGGAGKTSLAKKIKDLSYELVSDEASTEGIDIIRWSFDFKQDKPFRVNIWDFGGQEIYHATHQFFLTKRSLYALVVDTREENTDLYYWLNIVSLLSNDSPVLVIKNEKQERQCQVNAKQLRGEFENLKEILATNLKTNRGLDTIKANIQQYVTALPHVGQSLPKKWVDVRKALEGDPRNYISLDEFCRICEANDFQRQRDQLQLSDYLHDLGVCLHFQTDPLLKKTLILKPEWGTTAVYKALDTPEVKANLGRFSRTQLDTIWKDDEYAPMRDELLQLMRRFKLCYPIPGTDNEYIAPQLLNVEQPEYDWDDSNNLLLRYHYDFMPKGIITRFIVEMHRFIEGQKLVWKNGVVLNNGSAYAEVIEYYHKGEIHIRVSGNNCRDFLAVISFNIDEINASYERLKDKCKKLIPCNCPSCKGSQTPHFYPKEVLDKFLKDGQLEIQCQKSYSMVNVRGLIDDLVFPRVAKSLQAQTKSWPTQTEASISNQTSSYTESDARKIFLSYAWRSESEEVANQIDQAFQAKGITIVRDNRDIGFKGLIKEFMEELGRGKCVIAVIDDKYLKSPNCMFELVQVAQNGSFYDRIFPIVLGDVKLPKARDRLKYIRHWQEEIDALNQELRKFGDPIKISSIHEELNQYEDIRNAIDKLADTLKNMNTLTLQMHQDSDFQIIINAVEKKLSE
jgi:Leucine-rich repeat (LRR) protein/GTPase SAR1 family protein